METNALLVKEINPGSSSLTEALGISDDRGQELVKKVVHAMLDHPKITNVIAHCSRFCNHANELAFMVFVIGRMTESTKSPMDELFGRIGR